MGGESGPWPPSSSGSKNFFRAMRESLLKYLVDPASGEKFSLLVLAKEGVQVTAGVLRTKNSWYPIVRGVPRILVGGLRKEMLREQRGFLRSFHDRLPREAINEVEGAIEAGGDSDSSLSHQRKTAESFAFEWRKIYRENPFEESNFLHFLSPFLGKKDFLNKVVVDAGCGSGRFTKQAARFGALAVIGLDLSEGVDVAYELTKDLPNAHIVQADIYALPIHRSADLAFSVGVLHHLPEPEKGFQSMIQTVRPGGRAIIWVYNRRDNARAIYIYEPLRALLRPLPRPIIYGLGFIPATFVQLLNLLTISLQRLGFSNFSRSIPFSYYANFPFNMKLNDAFDVLATPKSNYYYKEEVESWFGKNNLGSIRSYEHPEAGITCVGVKSS